MIALIVVLVPPEPASASDTTVPAVAAGTVVWLTVWREWRDGLRLVTRDRTLSALLLVTGIVGFGSGLFTILVVIFARVILHGTVQVFGWLMTAQGVGGVIGGLLITSVSRVVPARYLLALGFGGPGLLLLTMVNIPVLPLVLGLFVLAGLLIVGAEVSTQTLLQTSVADQYRGRVLAAIGTTLTLVNLGSMALSSVVGDRVGVVVLLDVAGVLFFCGGAIAVVLVRGLAPGIGPSQEAAPQTARTTRS